MATKKPHAVRSVVRCDGCYSFNGEPPAPGQHTGHCEWAGVLYVAVQMRAGRKPRYPLEKIQLRAV